MRREIGDFRWEVGDELVDFDGAPAGGQKATGRATTVRFRDRGNLVLDAALVSWPEGQADMRAVQMLTGPVHFGRVVHGGRLGVRSFERDKWICDLRILKGKPDDPLWSNLVKAAREDLDLMAGCDAFELLRGFGAIDIDIRERLLGDTSVHKYVYAMTCDEGDVDAVVAAYTLTRLVAVHKGFGVRMGG